MKKSKTYDVVLIGAGLVGTSLVLALRDQGFKVAVLENHLPDIATNPKVDTRPISLSYGSHVILKALGLWPELSSVACPIQKVHVSDEGAFGAIHFDATEQQVPALGYVLPFSNLQRVLYQRAAAQTGVDIIPINALLEIDGGGADSTSTIKISTASGEQILTANLVVGADGGKSTSRKLLKMGVKQFDSGEVALATDLHLQSEHNECAYERFTREGTLAILPMWDRKRCRLVWTMKKNQAQDVSTWCDETLKTYIQNKFKGRIPVIKTIKRGQEFPLQTVMAKEQVRPGFVLLGNAAHTLYPVAAQGYNLGLRDAAALADVLIDGRQQMKSLGDIALLKRYYNWRVRDQKQVAGITAGVTTLFGLHVPLLKSARGLGLLATDLIAPVKKRLAKRLMGLGGRLPKLACSVSLRTSNEEA